MFEIIKIFKIKNNKKYSFAAPTSYRYGRLLLAGPTTTGIVCLHYLSWNSIVIFWTKLTLINIEIFVIRSICFIVRTK